MYHFLLTLQVIAVFITIFSIARLMNFRLGIDATILTITNACACVYAYGYLLTMRATNRKDGISALNFQLLGLTFLGTLFVLFTCEYCQLHFQKKIWLPLILFNGVLMCFGVTAIDHTFFYKSIEWTYTGYHPHIAKTPGPLYYVFVFEQVLFLLTACVILIRKYKRSSKQVEKNKILAIIIVNLSPFVGFIVERTHAIDGYDPTSLIIAISTASLSVFLTQWDNAGIVNRAYSSLYMNLEEGVIIADAEKRYIDSNAGASRIFPELMTWEPEEHLDKLGVDLCSFGKHDVFQVDRGFYTSTVKPIVEKRKLIGYLIIITDVTHIHGQMEEMRELKEEADSSNQAKSYFLANMSHEMRTPLNAIIGMTELAEREEDAQKTSEYLAQIKSSGKMLLDIVCDTLDISKAESGKLDILEVDFDTLPFLNTIINVINMRIGDKAVKLLVDIDPNLPKVLCGDDIRIRQIMINFLGNAEKYTNSGSITLKVSCEKLPNNRVLFKASIKDTGIGIKEDDLDKLFKPFSQVDMKNNRKVVGTGLGLAISAELIRLMGGAYKVESVYGEGSTFSFEIPLSVVDAAPFAPAAERAVIEVEKYTTFSLYDVKKEIKEEAEEAFSEYPDSRVLVVDDNKVNVKVLCAFLKQFKIEADFCHSGFDAIDKCMEKDYDLVFMDHMMPDMDGSETTEKIRASEKEWNKSMPIIACTANVMKGAMELFQESGMTDYMSKPVSLDVIKKKLALYLKQ